MSQIIWTHQVGDTKFRIVQLNPADCLVETSNHPAADPLLDRHWKAVDDDAVAAEVYMTAYLQARAAMAQIQILSCLDDFKSR